MGKILAVINGQYRWRIKVTFDTATDHDNMFGIGIFEMEKCDER